MDEVEIVEALTTFIKSGSAHGQEGNRSRLLRMVPDMAKAAQYKHQRDTLLKAAEFALAEFRVYGKTDAALVQLRAAIKLTQDAQP